MPGKKEIKWDAANDRKLLLGILKIHEVKVDCDVLAKYMATDDSKPTPNSVSKRLKKLKAMAKEEASGNDGNTAAPKTPAKRAAAGSANATPRKKTPNGGRVMGQDEDDEEALPSAKREKIEAKESVKKEEGGDEEDWFN